MLNEQELAKYFSFHHLPVKTTDWWDGLPLYYSNLKQYHPSFTQRFGQRPEFYKKYNMKGHNGIDIGYIDGTPVVAPGRLWVTYTQFDDDKGYGNHVFTETPSQYINGDYYKLDVVFGHLKNITCKSAHWLEEGDSVGPGDSTGDSSGPHLHLGLRPWFSKDGSNWTQVFNNNGYFGYVDPEPYFPHIVWDLDEILHPKGFIGTYKPIGYKQVASKGGGYHWEKIK